MRLTASIHVLSFSVFVLEQVDSVVHRLQARQAVVFLDLCPKITIRPDHLGDVVQKLDLVDESASKVLAEIRILGSWNTRRTVISGTASDGRGWEHGGNTTLFGKDQ